MEELEQLKKFIEEEDSSIVSMILDGVYDEKSYFSLTGRHGAFVAVLEKIKDIESGEES